MDMICAMIAGLLRFLPKAGVRQKKRKIAEKTRRGKRIFLSAAAAAAAVAVSFHGVYAQGRDQETEAGDETRRKEERVYGLDSLIQSVLLVQDPEVERLGISAELVLVGQRMGEREWGSSLGPTEQGEQNAKRFREKVLGISEDQLVMSDADYETLLKIVEAEAGGEDMEGKILVANVILNRVESQRFPSTVSEVVWENSGGSVQFSPTADGRIHTVAVSQETREAVNRAIDGEDHSQGALFFVEESYADADNVAWFKRDLKFLFHHGAHDFYTYP